MTDEAWLDTVRLARDCGNISSLFPKGITRIVDLPHTIHTAIRMALFFLSFENMPTDERPPRHIWLHSERMEEWFRMVKQNRENRTNPNHIDVSGMTENALLKDLFVGGHFG